MDNDIRADRQARVFLSYSRADETIAVRLRKDLEARGVEVFRDVDDTLLGEEWWARLKALISNSDAVVFLLSAKSVTSKVCASEVEYAQSLKKRIFPAVLAEMDWTLVPDGLRRIHSVFFNEESKYEKALQQLVVGVSADIAWIREHTRLLERALQWKAKDQDKSELVSGAALEAAERWITSQPRTAESPTSLHLEFIQASHDAQRAEQQRALEEAEERRRQMQVQRDRAEDALAAARTTADTIRQDISSEFRDAVGMSAGLKEKILGKVQALYDQLAESGENAPLLRRSQAIARSESASTLVTQGDLSGALDELMRSKSLIEDLLAANPDDGRFRIDLSIVFTKIAGILMKRGDLDDAAKLYKDALAINEAELHKDPWNPERMADVARSHATLGDAWLGASKLSDALTSFKNAKSTLEKLTAENPRHNQFQFDLASVFERIAFVHELSKDLKSAIEAYKNCVAATEVHTTNNPNNATLRRDFAVRLGRLGGMLVATGAKDEGMSSYMNALAILETLTDSDPNNTDWKHDMSVFLVRLGDALSDSGDGRKAFDYYVKASNIHEHLLEVNPENMKWHDDRIATYKRRCDLLIATGHPEMAVGTLQDILRVAEHLAMHQENMSVWNMHILYICYTLFVTTNEKAFREKALRVAAELDKTADLNKEQRDNVVGIKRLLGADASKRA